MGASSGKHLVESPSRFLLVLAGKLKTAARIKGVKVVESAKSSRYEPGAARGPGLVFEMDLGRPGRSLQAGSVKLEPVAGNADARGHDGSV